MVQPTAEELGMWKYVVQNPQLATLRQWITMAVEAARMSAVSKKKAKASARRAAVAWAEVCLEGAAAKAHSFVKGPGPNPDLMDVPMVQGNVNSAGGKDPSLDIPLQCSLGTAFITCPDTAAASRGRSWHKLWSRDQRLLNSMNARLSAQRRACIDEDEALVGTTDMVKLGMRKLNADAKPGGNRWTGRESRCLPDEAINDLTELLNSINEKVAWPRQVMHNIVVLLGKPKGGDRPICLVSWLIKLWEAFFDESVTEWEAGRIGFWDDAVKGSSALRAAAMRRLHAESAHLCGDEFAFILWDAQTFYDNVDLWLLYEASINCGMPRRQMLLSLLVLMAPRQVKVGNVVGYRVQPANGMTAGLKRANFFATLLLFKT